MRIQVLASGIAIVAISLSAAVFGDAALRSLPEQMPRLPH